MITEKKEEQPHGCDGKNQSDHHQQFVALIESQGYNSSSLSQFRSYARRLSRLMHEQDLSPCDLSEEVVEPLFRAAIMQIPPRQQTQAIYCLNRFRDYLIEEAGAPPRRCEPIDPSPRANLKRGYACYLKEQRGLTPTSISRGLHFFDGFMTFRFGNGLGDLETIRPKDIDAFVVHRRRPGKPSRDKTTSSHLRSIFRFLFWSGRTKRDLSIYVPMIRYNPATRIPRYLEPAQVEALIEAVRDDTPRGKRNYAMLLLTARLGLRAPEVVAIELQDINWRAGEILIRGKGGLLDRMPLPEKVGEALVDYICNGRRGSSRRLFVSSRAPFRRFADAQIVNYILQKAYDQTGIQPPQNYIGSHILRHSLATDMLRKGASLAEIGDILRHRARLTTTIYARHDIDALRSIARPWPVMEPTREPTGEDEQ